MKNFAYFQGWDELTVKECCVLSKMKLYCRDQTILGDDCGLSTYVYFIVKGRCQVIEHLLVTVNVINGKKRYQLYAATPSDDISIDTKPAELVVPETEAKEEEMQTRVSTASSAKEDSQPADDAEPQGIKSLSQIVAKLKLSDKKLKVDDECENNHLTDDVQEPDSKLAAESSNSVKKEEFHDKTSTTDIVVKPSSKLAPQASEMIIPSIVETHFMQVCILNPTACFGIGENMSHRRVIATTQTQCLLIPRNWLMQRNIGNIWVRVQQFLNKHIPTTKQVFQEFVNQRKWLAYRKKIAAEIAAKKKIATNNITTNVPYFIRINEEIDI